MKPKLVLHICCAPDEAWGVTVLKEQYDLICFFCNPNISPDSEYRLRLDEACRVAKHFDVPFESDTYDPDSWENAIVPYSCTPEGGDRCKACFLLRFRRTALFCKSVSIDSFATVLSVSPHKNIKMLNETGQETAKLHNVNYLETNLKKNDGFKKSTILSESLGLYRQDYCGCRLSKEERNLRNAARAAGAAQQKQNVS